MGTKLVDALLTPECKRAKPFGQTVKGSGVYGIGTELQYHQAKASFADPFSAKDTLAWPAPYESQSDITPDTIQQNQTSSAWVCFGVRDNGMIVDKKKITICLTSAFEWM